MHARFYSNLDKAIFRKSKYWKSQYNTIHSNKLFWLSHQRKQHDHKRIIETERINNAKQICKRQVAFDLSSKDIPEKYKQVVAELGLNFQITPTIFPVVDVVQAVELCCQAIEQRIDGDQVEHKERAAKVRKLMLDHVLECHDMKIQSNISKREWKAINYIKAIPELIVGKADKGNGIMFEDEKQYIQKEQDQMDICDVEPAKSLNIFC